MLPTLLQPYLPLSNTQWRLEFPAIAVLALLAPGFRNRKAAPLPLEVARPDAARTLRRMQRDSGARFVMSAAGAEAALAVEHGVEGHLLVHYTDTRGTLTIAGGWLGAGRRRYLWLPLRLTLAWSAITGAPANGAGNNGNGAGYAASPTVTSEEIAELAANLHVGLDLTGTRHVLEEFFEPAPIPLAERMEVLDSYANFMQSHGWQVTYDEAFSRRSLRRSNVSENPESWSSADREALTRLEALVAEMLKGVRSSSRVLFQTK